MPQIEPKQIRGIVAAACQLNGLTFSVPAPGRHHDVLEAMHTCGIGELGYANQGFLDHRGIYVGRKHAMIIAHRWDQIIEGEFEDGGELFSEHLW